MSEWMDRWMSESVSEWMSEWMSEQKNEPRSLLGHNDCYSDNNDDDDNGAYTEWSEDDNRVICSIQHQQHVVPMTETEEAAKRKPNRSITDRGTPDPDGYPVDFMDPIRIRAYPISLDPVRIRIGPDPGF